MRIHLLAVGTRMSAWVKDAYSDYARRLPRECELRLQEIALGKRTRGSAPQRAVEDEGKRMLAAVPKQAIVIALEVEGHPWSTPELSTRLKGWMQSGRDVAILVGGPDGLADEVAQQADTRWSLSALTLPHGLVRVVVAEQLYRAWSLLHGHPYHK